MALVKSPGELSQIAIVGDSNAAFQIIRQLASTELPLNFITWRGEKISVKDLCRLIISNCNLSELITVAKDFVNLTHLNLSFNNLKDISSISQLSGLQLLDVSHNKLGSLPLLDGLTNLSTFRCNHNSIESIEPLRNSGSMEELWLNNNKIPWAQFLNLNEMKSLTVITKSENPCDDKARFNEFLFVLIPTLKFMDGQNVSTRENPDSIPVDVRVMLTQARAQQKISINDNEGTSKRRGLPKASSANTLLLEGPSHQLQITQDAATDGIAIEAPPSHRVKRANSDDVHNQLVQKKNNQVSFQPPPSPSSLTKIFERPSVQNGMEEGNGLPLNIQHSKDDSNYISLNDLKKDRKRLTRDAANPLHQEEADGDEALVDNLTVQSSPQKPSNKASMMNAPKGIAKRLPKKYRTNKAAQSISADQDPTILLSDQNPKTLIKFGELDDSPIALCAYDNGDGYVRWSKNGPIACSLENNRMFASYRSGAIAAIYDRTQGNGSIMDHKGRCLLMLSEENSVAKVLDEKGNIVHTYQKADSKPIMNATNHSWNIEGLQMEFRPEIWEVIIECQNEKVVATFSSITGCQLVKEKKSTNQKKGALNAINQQKERGLTDNESGNSDLSSVANVDSTKQNRASPQRKNQKQDSLASREQEEKKFEGIGAEQVAIQEGLKNFQTDLDSMLAGIQGIKSLHNKNVHAKA